MYELTHHLYTLFFTIILYVAGIGAFFTLLLIYLSNPFRKLTIVKSLFSSYLFQDQLVLLQIGEPKIHTSLLWNAFAWLKCGVHIAKNSLIAAPGAAGKTIEEIIGAIHRLRYNPAYPFMISGDHFSMFYPRNLGVFYGPILDPRVYLDETDWLNRERKYLQTTAYALATFSEAGRLATTIVPSGRRSVILLNIFAYPSDTLFGIVHALKSLCSSQFFMDTYPFKADSLALHTKTAANELLEQHRDSLIQLYNTYRSTVYDESTGLIREGIRLSSALDTKIRSSAFYDNVIYWRTTQLMQELGLLKKDSHGLLALKKRILETFWYEEGGYFLDDCSEAARNGHHYSSDWTVILSAGFLNPAIKEERTYFEKTVAYVRLQHLDKPFPLKVIGSVDKSKDHFWVRTFVSNYQDNAIWSNLGVQYIKVLCLLYLYTKNTTYLSGADSAITAYKQNMIRYHGYPELYDSSGKMLRSLFYRSIRQTGWVIDFEHALALYNAVSASS